MCFTLSISETGRRNLGLTVTVLDSILSILGIALVAIAIYINVHLESKMALMEGYDSGTLPYFLLVVGLLMFAMDAIFAKAAHSSAFPDSRATFQNMLVLFLALKFVLIWVVLAGSIVCFTHQSVISASFKNGMMTVMKRYKTDLGSKAVMDRLQAQYHCCGSNVYKDWFEVNWVNEEYLNTKDMDVQRKLKGGLYYNDDTPYSCCDISIPRPCVHHDVRKKDAHINYGSLTLYKHGCAGVLMEYISKKILSPTGYTLLAAFFLQMLTCILLRFLQTSIGNACLMESPLGIGAGYIVPQCPCEMCQTGDPMKYVKRGKYVEDEEEAVGGGGGGNESGGGRNGIGGGDTGGKDGNKKKKEKGEKDKKKDKGTDSKGKDKDKTKKGATNKKQTSPKKSPPKKSSPKKSPKKATPKKSPKKPKPRKR